MEPISQRPMDALSPDEMCLLARDPTQAPRLEEYLGPDYYRDLAAAVRGPARAPSRAAKGSVVLLHGILGSQIGKVKSRDGSWDIVWLNPLAICAGDMKHLRLGAGKSRYGARGLLPMFYSLLWARLKYWHGFNLVEFAYDWRVSIEDSAAELVSFLEEETSGPVSLVAHSMGGLVARAALPLLGGGETNGRLERVVQLATPNYGSFMPVLTLRGQNKWINQVLAIDGHNSLDDLISGVLSTFEGLCELMPAPSRFSAMDLFDRATWPADPAVDGAVLAKAKQVIDSLPQPDDRFVLIAGANQATVTSISRDPDSGEFVPCQTFEGDGTVPLALARFDASLNVPTYLANVTHSGIVADGKVADALNDLLTTDETKRLDVDTPAAARRRESPRPLDVRSARDPFQGRRGDALLPAEKHRALREVLGPLAPEGPHGDALAARAE